MTIKYISSIIVTIATVLICETEADYCGCKNLRPCYQKMLDDLLGEDEDACVENAAIGASTVTIFLKALKTYCDKIVEVHERERTYEGKVLYEVVLTKAAPAEVIKLENSTQKRPIIFLDAGQDAGSETVGFALYIIEQLVACSENREMLKNMIWVILPSTNPDGQEYGRSSPEWWQKNYRPLNNKQGYGVDVTRNFEQSFSECPIVGNIFSQNYPGPYENSEVESKFITNILTKYANNIKSYVSLRRNGHAILYPFATNNVSLALRDELKIKAADIAKKVNQRAGLLQYFVNQSIIDMNGKPHCGHSVDYAFTKLNIPLTFEMRVFPDTDNHILSKFQALPKGYDISLRMGYFSGIRELYNLILIDSKFGKV